ncbi:MAG: hypothetical protein EOP89_18425 [Lysobacteraceae bacterium]|nr:MAG: hypothetical protein EOP89_18425 [Xanthomonadaceae bacterium]
MLRDVGDSAPPLEAQLNGIATRLMDIAGQVALEAEAATTVVRGMVNHAARVAELAAALEAAAEVIELEVRQQAESLASARARLGINAPVIAGLGRSITSVQTISAVIAGIAQESRILSLNARIEAARAGADGAAFGVVATEMSKITAQIMAANDDVRSGGTAIAREVVAASDLTAITAETVSTVDAAAAAIGRVGANAVAVKVLAKQLSRLTR